MRKRESNPFEAAYETAETPTPPSPQDVNQKWWNRRVMLPRKPACKAGVFLVEPRSHLKTEHIAPPRGGQVSRLHVLVLEASALLVEPPPQKDAGTWRCVNLVRLPGIAPGSLPWQRSILLLNHSRVLEN